MSWAQDTKLRFQFFALFATVACPAGIIWMAKDTMRQVASNGWPAVEGEIESVIAKNWWDEDSKTMKFFGRAVYRYAVQNQEYESDLTDLSTGVKRATQLSALNDVARYTPGMKIPVYYDPQDPGVGVLERGIPPVHLALLIGLSIGAIICPIASFFSIRGWIRGAKRFTAAAEG